MLFTFFEIVQPAAIDLSYYHAAGNWKNYDRESNCWRGQGYVLLHICQFFDKQVGMFFFLHMRFIFVKYMFAGQETGRRVGGGKMLVRVPYIVKSQNENLNCILISWNF